MSQIISYHELFRLHHFSLASMCKKLSNVFENIQAVIKKSISVFH